MKISTYQLAILKTIISDFYKKAINDDLIGFHFNHIKDFDKHITKIEYFWIHVLTTTVSPTLIDHLLTQHKPMPIKMGQLNRWVLLFRETIDFHLENEDAERRDLKKNLEHSLSLLVEHFQKSFFR